MPAPVALESSVIAHGLPHPANVETALQLETIVRAEGGVPQTAGCVDGHLRVGLSEAQIRHLATADDVQKVSLRDLPVVAAENADGGTTVAATMHLAYRSGIEVMATGGIGGVHRTTPPEPAWDVSADLEALRRTPMTVFCSGPKIILDLPATREVLESYGVTVVGYQTDTMPAFYSPSSDCPVDVRCDAPSDIATLIRNRDRFGLDAALLITVPPPKDAAIPRPLLEPVLERAVADAADRDLRAEAVTPFLLERLRQIKGERIVETNRALLHRNTRLATQVAHILA
ncbi:pseudouridine-5-phosphate glycosidase [Salinibacter sp. 10B]|uniref:pseudouridine-5'-phosphate glycosidase n=1 Tax=Salinibacter sp. 10B TaxID=1923971 RepID=UPI000CF4990B|nr:pseudouridine-5'-phosphate glycosidase [Salinibacter sp. 10B]PQJ34114.1 pseudouridine-5-phosphate glycosidase [Salinibacter sp. 10B]